MLDANIRVAHNGRMMTLAQWMDDEGVGQADLVRDLGISQSTASKLVLRKAKPSLDLAVRIERRTKGAVPASSWIDAPTDLPPTPDPESRGEGLPACDGGAAPCGGADPKEQAA